MTAPAKQVIQLSFIGAFLGAMIPVATFSFWLGQLTTRVDTLEVEVVRLRDKKQTTALYHSPYGFKNETYFYAELPRISNTELPLP